MKSVMRAIEVAGTIDEHGQLRLDEPLPVMGPARTRVLLLFRESGHDLEEAEWLRAASRNPAFEFLAEAAEDIYTVADGRPFHDQGLDRSGAVSLRRSVNSKGPAGSLLDRSGGNAPSRDPGVHHK